MGGDNFENITMMSQNRSNGIYLVSGWMSESGSCSNLPDGKARLNSYETKLAIKLSRIIEEDITKQNQFN